MSCSNRNSNSELGVIGDFTMINALESLISLIVVKSPITPRSSLSISIILEMLSIGGSLSSPSALLVTTLGISFPLIHN